MSNYLVSVIVPVYNVEKYLNRCIDSIIKQTYCNLEIILVDDGSPDNCGNICDEYEKKDDRIRVIHKKNGGLSSARNAGLDIATGDYIFFVDSDDWIVNDAIEYMVNLMEKYDSSIVSINYDLVKDDYKYKKEDVDSIRVFNRDEALHYYLKTGMSNRISEYPAVTKLYKKYLFSTIRFPLGTLYEDYATNVKIIKQCDVYVKSLRVCYFYYQGGTSIVRSKFKMKDLQLIEQSRIVCDLLDNDDETIKKIAKEKLNRSYLSLILKIVFYGWDDSILKEERKKIMKSLLLELRKNKRDLFNSSLPFNRKIILTIILINYRLLYPLKLFFK